MKNPMDKRFDKIRKKVTASNEKWMNMDKETYEEMQTVEKQMLFDLTLYLKRTRR